MSLKTLERLMSSGVKLTPMMEQYYQIKKQYPDLLLLFRMGDFYELFFDDAIEASKLLNISLTHRGKLGDYPIPMSGIPHHAASAYIDRITARGLKAVICDQIEDPKDAVGIVRRGVTQVVSPGMPYDLSKTPEKEQRFIASAFKKDGQYYLIILDFTTGDFKGFITESAEGLVTKAQMFAPREFITCMGQWEGEELITRYLTLSGVLKTHLSEEYFDKINTAIYTEKIIPAFKRDKIIAQSPEILNPIGALAYYICSTQMISDFVHIRPFQIMNEKGTMKVTVPTLSGLEILPKSPQEYNQSLLGFVDKSQTSMGSRALRQLFLSPSAHREEILKRHNLVEALINNTDLLSEIRSDLSGVRDLERIMAKISTGKAINGDLINLCRAIFIYEGLEKKLKEKLPDFESLGLYAQSKKEKETLKDLAKHIEKAINDEIGATLDKGNLIKPGYSKERDRLCRLSQNASEELLKMEEGYKEQTKIPKLRVRSNNVAGFYIEVPKAQSSKMPKSFRRVQTLVNAERYVTAELESFEKEILSAKEKLSQVERAIFKELLTEVASNKDLVINLAKLIGHLDIYQSLSHLSLQEGFVRPEIADGEKVLHVEGGWHPLIKNNLHDQFVSHDVHLDESFSFALITGPNMAGKTTVMRELAIIQFLAQLGCFVPAKKATLGICDHLFSRLGASDDILRGQSTFMVEMTETAEIIRHATANSLIILDEVGRGTSTYDGLSIAWALVEHFVTKTKALTLFATHYHELVEVVEGMDNAKNFTMEIVNNKGDVQFLYRFIEGHAQESYGIYVGKLAGLPSSLLRRSEEILKSLEDKNEKEFPKQLPLLPEIPVYLQKLEEEVEKMDPLRMTPLEALQKLADIKKLLS